MLKKRPLKSVDKSHSMINKTRIWELKIFSALGLTRATSVSLPSFKYAEKSAYLENKNSIA